LACGRIPGVPVEDDQFHIVCDPSFDNQRTAAGVWARATARRDGLTEAAAIDDKLPEIRSSLLRDGTSLHVARRRGNAVGVALAVPQGESQSLEVLYLGVDPEPWGAGVGARLLRHLDDYASAKAYGGLELWVIADNERAIDLYERAGWQATDEVKIRSSAGRLERRFVRQVPLTRVEDSQETRCV